MALSFPHGGCGRKLFVCIVLAVCLLFTVCHSSSIDDDNSSGDSDASIDNSSGGLDTTRLSLRADSAPEKRRHSSPPMGRRNRSSSSGGKFVIVGKENKETAKSQLSSSFSLLPGAKEMERPVFFKRRASDGESRLVDIHKLGEERRKSSPRPKFKLISKRENTQ